MAKIAPARLLKMAITLLVIVFLTQFLLIIAERGRVVMLLVSVLGTSIPSFLLAMLLWIVNIQLHNRFDTPLLPLTGSGLDAHIILPALVLMAARWRRSRR
jgi:hypothetical protein